MSDTQLQILIKEYELHHQEVNIHLEVYQSHLNRFQFIVGACAVVVAFFLTNETAQPNAELWWWFWLGATMIPLAVTYLGLAICQPIYHMALLSARLAKIEQQINSCLGRRALIWDSQIVPKFLGEAKPLPGVLNPGPFWYALVVILFGGLALSASGALHNTLWKLTGEGWGAQKVAVLVGSLAGVASIVAGIRISYSVAVGMRPRIARWMIRLDS